MALATSDRAGDGSAVSESGVAWKGLAGFFLAGLLFSFLGVILPVWRHYLSEDYLTAGNYFLFMGLGAFSGVALSHLLRRRTLSSVLAIASGLAAAGLACLGLIPVGSPTLWQAGGIVVLGCGAGLLITGMFRAVAGIYVKDPAATTHLSGAMFGAGCVLMSVLVAGTYYVYTVTSILILIALIPGFFIPIYARSRFTPGPPSELPSLRQTIADLKSPGPLLFALLVFFQFGNEWSVAGWLPVFLIQRLGISPESSLTLLAMYWLTLMLGRVVVFSLLPWISARKCVLVSGIATVLGCSVLMSTDNRFGAISGILLVAGGFAAVYPVVVGRVGHRFPYLRPGFFSGIFTFALTGGLLAPWTVGIFASLWGIRMVMLLPLIGTIVVIVLLVVIWAEARFRERTAHSA